jgi:hypothetical protein
MNRWGACAFVFFFFAVSVCAQTPPAKAAIETYDDYSKAMKEVAAQNAALRKSLATPSATDASAAAARLETIFKDVQAYWENKKVEDAATAARNAVAAAQTVSKAVAAHDTTGAAAASQALGGTCMVCHAAHRERLTYDFYRIK